MRMRMKMTKGEGVKCPNVFPLWKEFVRNTKKVTGEAGGGRSRSK